MFPIILVHILSNSLDAANAFSVDHSFGSRRRSELAILPQLRSTSTTTVLGHGSEYRNDVGGFSSLVEEQQQKLDSATRRNLLGRSAASLFLGVSQLVVSPQHAKAVASSVNTGDDEGVVSQIKLATLLKRIPTFAIVDTSGVPYFVVGEDAKLTSYFFLSYGEAKRILDVAISSSDRAIERTRREMKAKNHVITKQDEDEIGINPWKSARITSVPLDLAVSLASKGKLAGAYFRLAPSELDIENALAIDGSDDLPEGKVPLFYIEDMTISYMGEEVRSPLYFQKDQALAEYKHQMKRKSVNNSRGTNASTDTNPKIKVTELFATITEMLRPGGTDDELKTVCFIPPADSISRAEQCRKNEKEPFRLGERLIVL